MAVHNRKPTDQEYKEYLILSLLSDAGQVYSNYIAQVEPDHQYSVFKKADLDDILLAYKVDNKIEEMHKISAKMNELYKQNKERL